MHEQAKTRIAVVIPVYGAQYLPACLASVFNQTRPADEVIVVDDGSPEGSLIDEAVARYGERVVRLRQPNLGAGGGAQSWRTVHQRRPDRVPGRRRSLGP